MSKYIVTFNDPRKVGCAVTRTFEDMPLTSILEGFGLMKSLIAYLNSMI